MKQTGLKMGQLLFSVRGLLLLVMIVTLTTGCDRNRRFKSTIKGKKKLTYQINTTGNTDQTGTISASDLISDIGGDYRSNALIESFRLEALSIEMDPTATSTAIFFQIQSLAVTKQNSSQYELLNLSKLPSTSFPLNKVGATIINDLLLVEGLDGLNRDVSSQLVGKHPGEVRSDKSVGIRIRGNNFPASSRVSVTLTIYLDVAIEYSTCRSVPEALFTDLPSCY